MQDSVVEKISNSEYESLISKSLNNKIIKSKSIVDGKVLSIENDMVIIDIGLKSEGRIPLTEFSRPGKEPDIEVNQTLKVFIESVDSANGETKLSREKAIKQEAWNFLQECYDNKKIVKGTPYNRVKGGMSVDLEGVTAFLPGSQIDTKQIIKDTKELLNKSLDLMILKMDKFRGNIVVSRRAISDAELKEQRAELLTNIAEGSILEGRVKNITDYGAFIDLGGIDGLVHVTDIAWKKINHPSDILELGASIKVKVLKYDEELVRLSLGIKQLTDDPWIKVNEDFKINDICAGTVSALTDNGVLLNINDSYDGFVPLNELTWLKKPPHPSKIIEMNEKLETKIIELDNDKKRIILSLKQLKNNPWLKLTNKYNVNDTFDTEIVNVVDFGIFVKVHEEIDGMVHVSDLSWNEKENQNILSNFTKGESIKVKILEINTEKERISLGIKQLQIDPLEEFINENPIKSKVSGKITSIDEKGITISINDYVSGFIKKNNLSKDKTEQKIERFAINEVLDSMILSIDKKTRSLNLSIKEIEIEEEKTALSKYGSNESGASLGDILSSALKKKKND